MLTALAAIGPVAMNIFLPSIPGMSAVFQTETATVQMALSLYLGALAVAQLFVGPISDQVGRRPLVLWGLVICIGGSLVCILAPTIEFLILGRVCQAVGACTGLVMGRTMIRDMYGLDKAASMIGYLTMIMVLAPMVSPYLGATLDEAFDWRGGFVLVLTMALVMLLISGAILGETHRGPYVRASFAPMFAAFWMLLRQARFSRHALQISLSSGAFFAFIGGAPHVSQNLMGFSKSDFGLYFMIAGLCYMAGNFVTGRRSEVWGAERLVVLGTGAGLLGGVWLTGCHAADSLTPLTLFAGMGIIAFGNGLCLPSGTASAISADKDRIGAAAGLAGFMQMATGALCSHIAGVIVATSALPLVILMAALTVGGFLVNIIGRMTDKPAGA